MLKDKVVIEESLDEQVIRIKAGGVTIVIRPDLRFVASKEAYVARVEPYLTWVYEGLPLDEPARNETIVTVPLPQGGTVDEPVWRPPDDEPKRNVYGDVEPPDVPVPIHDHRRPKDETHPGGKKQEDKPPTPRGRKDHK